MQHRPHQDSVILRCRLNLFSLPLLVKPARVLEGPSALNPYSPGRGDWGWRTTPVTVDAARRSGTAGTVQDPRVESPMSDWRSQPRNRSTSTKVDERGRVCTKCRKYKKWSQFAVNRSAKTGHRTWCKSCVSKHGERWREESDYYSVNRARLLAQKKAAYNPVSKKDYDLSTKYGISLADFRQMLRDQEYKCKICLCRIYVFSRIKRNNRVAVVDHCHLTGVIRGLLCHNCNRGLGLVADNYSTLARATRYVKFRGQI